MNDARLWHPWLRINRVLRAMLHTRWSAEGLAAGEGRVQEGAGAEESDPARGVVQLELAYVYGRGLSRGDANQAQ